MTQIDDEMLKHIEISNETLYLKIKEQVVSYGGNLNLKIYGTLHCQSGKRMKKENRVFFKSVEDAEAEGYRPCGNCLREDYKKWKDGLI